MARRHKSQLAGNKRSLPFIAPGLVLGLLLPRSCEKFGQMLDSGRDALLPAAGTLLIASGAGGHFSQPYCYLGGEEAQRSQFS